MRVLGLRIGTTNISAAVASADGLSAQSITFDGDVVLPTVVAHHGDEWFVGRRAKAFLLRPDAEVFVHFLHDQDEEQPVRPQLVSIVVREVRRLAEVQIGEAIHHCVLSVPAYFGSREREVLEDGVRGELKVLATIQEPLCAIVGAEIAESSQAALVVRMGGGGFDVAVARRRSPWTIVQIDGDTHVGGAELDRLLADWYVERLAPKEQDYLRTHSQAQRRLLTEAERVKCILSTNGTAVFGPLTMGPAEISGAHEICRAEFDHLAESVADHLAAVVERCAEHAEERGVPLDQIDSFVFHGGSSAIPFLRKTLEERMRHPVAVPPAAATLSARGAALIGAGWAKPGSDGAAEDDAVLLCNLTAEESISVELSDGRQLTVIERGTSLPISAQVNLSLVQWTDELRIPVYKGTSLVGDFVARMPALRGPGASVHLDFHMDSDQRIGCRVAIPDAGVTMAADLLPSRTSTRQEMPAGRLDSVHFTLTAPPVMSPGRTHELDFWAHLSRQRREVIRRAKEQAAGIEIRGRSIGPTKVSRGTVLTVRLEIADLSIDPPFAPVLWDGDIGNVGFLVTVPGDAPLGTRAGSARIHIAGLRIATLSFVVEVQPKSMEGMQLVASEERARRAFASYASDDRNAVLARIQGIQKAAPAMDVFVDVARLRSGDNWREALKREILGRDTLYLFWSQAASQSKEVDWEWRCALEQHGIRSIDPVPLVSPEVVPPPAELASQLHFNDWVIAYMRNERAG